MRSDAIELSLQNNWIWTFIAVVIALVAVLLIPILYLNVHAQIKSRRWHSRPYYWLRRTLAGQEVPHKASVGALMKRPKHCLTDLARVTQPETHKEATKTYWRLCRSAIVMRTLRQSHQTLLFQHNYRFRRDNTVATGGIVYSRRQKTPSPTP